MTRLFTKANLKRLTKRERAELMHLQMSSSGSDYGGGGYLPDDCSECGACGQPTLGTGWCDSCHARFNRLRAKALGPVPGERE